MSEETKGTTPSQAPAMSREEWEAKLTELCNECDVDSFVRLKKEILDDIMSIQAEVERLRTENQISWRALHNIMRWSEDDDGDPGWLASVALRAIEKSRQPK